MTAQIPQNHLNESFHLENYIKERINEDKSCLNPQKIDLDFAKEDSQEEGHHEKSTPLNPTMTTLGSESPKVTGGDNITNLLIEEEQNLQTKEFANISKMAKVNDGPDSEEEGGQKIIVPSTEVHNDQPHHQKDCNFPPKNNEQESQNDNDDQKWEPEIKNNEENPTTTLLRNRPEAGKPAENSVKIKAAENLSIQPNNPHESENYLTKSAPVTTGDDDHVLTAPKNDDDKDPKTAIITCEGVSGEEEIDSTQKQVTHCQVDQTGQKVSTTSSSCTEKGKDGDDTDEEKKVVTTTTTTLNGSAANEVKEFDGIIKNFTATAKKYGLTVIIDSNVEDPIVDQSSTPTPDISPSTSTPKKVVTISFEGTIKDGLDPKNVVKELMSTIPNLGNTRETKRVTKKMIKKL